MTARKTTPNPTKPKFMVVEFNLHYITNAGEELKFNLDVPTGLIFDLAEKGDGNEIQFVQFLEGMGDHDTLEAFRKLGWLSEGNAIVTRYFEEFGKLHGVEAGE